jgi:hypothetical protein
MRPSLATETPCSFPLSNSVWVEAFQVFGSLAIRLAKQHSMKIGPNRHFILGLRGKREFNSSADLVIGFPITRREAFSR